VKLTIHLHLILTLKAVALLLLSTYAAVAWCLVTEVIPVEYMIVIQKKILKATRYFTTCITLPRTSQYTKAGLTKSTIGSVKR
jgi:hypothetical protein